MLTLSPRLASVALVPSPARAKAAPPPTERWLSRFLRALVQALAAMHT